MTAAVGQRTWTLTSTGERPLTVNQVAKLHRQQWAACTRVSRIGWWGLAKEAKVPRLERVRLVVTPLHRDRRSPQDVAACAPEVKAAVDGLVDAGVLPDDDPTHLLAITFCPPDVCGVDGLRIEIQEVPE